MPRCAGIIESQLVLIRISVRNMRPLYLIVANMISELGGAEKMGPMLGVTANQAHKYGEDPERSGKPIPLERFIDLLGMSGNQTHNNELQVYINEALEHFTAPAHRKIVTDALLTDLDHFLDALKSGGQWKPKSVTVACPQCTNEMYLIKSDQGQVYVCRDCLARVDWK